MAITFLRPLFLLLIPAIALLWWVRRGSDRGQTGVRPGSDPQRLMRAGVFLTLLLALAQPVLLTPDRNTYQVFVVDYSASVSAAARQQQKAGVMQARGRAGGRDVTSLVVMGDAKWRDGADAIDTTQFGTAIEVSDPISASSLDAALAAASRQIPEGARGVIHLFTDGLATDRRWAPEVQRLIERGIVVNTYDLGFDPRDVYPAGMTVDKVVRVGQAAHVGVDVAGTAKGVRVRLVGSGGEEIAISAPLDVDDHAMVPLTFEPKASGFLDLTAQVTVPSGQDIDPKNNDLVRTLAVQDPLRVLYLGDRQRGASARVSSLLGRGFNVTDGSDQSLDSRMDLSGYDLVMLDDRPASKVPEGFQKQLAEAVQRQGLGFVFTGGRSAFGTGGYDSTPVAQIVPVDFVQRTEKRDPSTALAIIIDTSGSMTGTRIELAKQVARLAVRRLKAHDRIGIVEFYGNKHWALPLQSAANKVTIDRAIGRMQAIGGTVLMPAIEEAYYGLKNVDTRYKHIVIITDAGVETSDYEGMIRQIAKDGINVSTVLTGSQAHNQLMIDMASWGKGRFYSVVDRYSLPELILKQPSTMKLPAYKTGAFNVQSRGGEGWWSDIDRRQMPALDGYVETTARTGAETLMEVEGSEDPVLTTWRYGLGRVTALTTEPVGEGTNGWKDWRDYGRLLARIVTRTADDTRLFDYSVSRTDHVLSITARRDSRDQTLYPEAVVLDLDGSEKTPVRFRQEAPGQFLASVAIDPRAGVRLVATAHSTAAPRMGQQPTRLISTAADDVSPERQVDPELGMDLEALATATQGSYTDTDALAGGKLATAAPGAAAAADTRDSLALFRLWPALLILSLLMYVIEIAYRRWPVHVRRALRATGTAALFVLLVGASVASVPSVASAQSALGLLTPAHVDPKGIVKLYNETIVRDGNIDKIIPQLVALEKDATKAKRYRANAALVRSHLEWRHGRLGSALAAVDAGLAIESTDELLLLKARILDASGKVVDARDFYQKALAATVNPQIKETIRLRLTFADAIDSNVKSLVELAKTRPVDFRNRAAIALGILDFSKEATELYQISAEGTERFRQQLRVAQWAIRGNEAVKAQEAAWQAVRAATMDRDRKYALSLLVEAHNLDKSLPKLLDKFAEQKTLTVEEQSVRVDLLRQTGQFDKAIELFRSAHGAELDPELRLELLRMYRDGGQDAAMVTEYRQLIAREPNVIEWPEGLSQYYLEQGDQPNARKVWEDFLGRTTSVGMLLLGAEAMTSFGLHDLAQASVDKALKVNTSVEDAAQVRLAQFDLYRHRGMTAEAEAALASLDALVPPDSPYRSELADAYERLQKPQLAAKVLEGLQVAKGGLSTDEAMRLAWLLDSVGRRDDAIKMWRDLWSRETLATRQRLIEDRLLMLAAELGTLGDLAVELEEKLAKAQASPRDISLLVSIYTKVGDSVSAIETVTTAASQGGKNAKSEVAALKEQAQIYLSLNEYEDYARVTRRLLEIDPAGRVDYLQSLLLNQIEAGNDNTRTPKDETTQLKDYLAKLRQAGGAAVNAEFEAGVMELAGFRDQAIDAYRRALALHPERADDHLLLADLLRQAGKQNEAVASLQYITEIAETDELFLIAIDGITNMRTGNVGTIKWAERRALERLTSGDDKLYLYEMLSDLAEEARDIKVYIASMENSLAHADSRRSHVLRELLAATAEVTSYEQSQRAIQPNQRLNVAYARRLISLGEELPPEVYVDLGRTFIKMNDPAAARRAFNLAVDRTGRTSVVLDAAKLFEAGGFDREAIAEYEKALIANSGSIETMYRLARLRERAGNPALANDLYLRALMTVINQQTRAVERGVEKTPPLLESLVTFDYRRYFQVLVTGYLATLPPAGEARAAQLQKLENSFNNELAQVTAAAPASGVEALAYYPRLTVLNEAVRTSAFSVGVPDPAYRASASLLKVFGRDATVVTDTAAAQEMWGFAKPPATATPAPAAPSAAANPGSAPNARPMDSDFLRDIGLALNKNDQDAALVIYRQWARFAAGPKPPLRLGFIELVDQSPGIPEVANHAFQRLDARHFGSLAQYIQGLIADNESYADKLILDRVYSYETMDVPILTRLENVLGQPLISEERMLRLVNKRTEWAQLNLPYVMSHLTQDRQIDLLERYGKAGELVNWSRYLSSFGLILNKPLDAAPAARLTASVKATLQNGLRKANGPAYLTNFMNYPFTAGVHESNVPIVLDVEAFIAEKYPQSFKIGYFKANLLRDVHHDEEALAAFVDAALRMYVPMPTAETVLTAGMPSPYAYQSFIRTFAPFIFPKYKADVMKLLDQREAGPDGLTDALISLRTELNNNDPQSDPRQLLEMLQAMANRNPKNEKILNTLWPLYDQWGDTLKAIDVLAQLSKLRPEDRTYKYRLVTMWQRLDRPEKVVEALGTDTMESIMPQAPSRNLYIESVGGPALVRFPSLKRSVDAIKAVRDGGDVQAAQLGLRTLLQTLPPSGMSLNEFAQTRDPNEPYLYYRDLLMADGENPPKPPAPPPPPAGARTAAPAAASGATAAAATPPPPPSAPVATTQVVTVQAVAGGTVMMVQSVPAGGSPGPGSANIYDRLATSLESMTGPLAASDAPKPAKLLDVAARSAYAVAEFESYLGTLRAEDIDKQYFFYTLMVDAYINNGRADAELERRTPQLRAGSLGRKDVTVWLGLASKQPKEKAADFVRAAEEAGLTTASLNGLQRLFLARTAVKAGRMDKAVELYSAVATDILAGSAGTIQPNTLSVDAYGRDQGLYLFTGLGLFDEARQTLDADSLNRFVGVMLGLAKPPSSAILEQNFSRFALVMYVRSTQLGLSIPSLAPVVAAVQPSPNWTRTEVLQAAYVRARLGQVDDALRMLQSVLKRDLDTRDPITAITSNSMFAARQYQQALGIIGDPQLMGPFGTTGTGVEEFKPVFPTKADAWPGAGDWVARAAREVSSWSEARTINRDAASQLLSLLAIRLNQHGNTAGAAQASASIAAIMRAGQVSMKSATLAVVASEKAGAPLDLGVVQDLVRVNRLHSSRVLATITRTEKQEGAEKALQLGEAAAAFSSSDELLKQLVTIAKNANRADDLQKWTDRQQQAANARAQLAKKPASGAGK